MDAPPEKPADGVKEEKRSDVSKANHIVTGFPILKKMGPKIGVYTKIKSLLSYTIPSLNYRY